METRRLRPVHAFSWRLQRARPSQADACADPGAQATRLGEPATNYLCALRHALQAHRTPTAGYATGFSESIYKTTP
jgi:hypothetical protein